MKCVVCGGTVVPATGAGRTTRYRNLPNLEIPDNMPIPTCDQCGEEWLDERTANALDTVLEAAWRQRMHLLATKSLEAIARAGVSQGELERELDLAQGYLTKLKNGSRIPSAELALHLAFIAVNPARRLKELREILRQGGPDSMSQPAANQAVSDGARDKPASTTKRSHGRKRSITNKRRMAPKPGRLTSP